MVFPSKNISEYAKFTLKQLAVRHLGNKLSLGGAFGLLHYLDYRPTHDVDAWWLAETTPAEQKTVLAVIEDTLAQRLAVETHLSRIIQHRPLENTDDSNQRIAAQQIRSWFQTEFLDALSN